MPAMVSLGETLTHEGGSPILFQHLFWFFGHQEVYIVALPAFGIVSKTYYQCIQRKTIFGYRMMVLGDCRNWCFKLFCMGSPYVCKWNEPLVWFLFCDNNLIIAVPTAIKVYNWILTLWRGNIQLSLPMLFSLGFIVTFLNGGLTGLFLGNVAVDVPLSDTYFVVAHFHMVMGIAPILVVFGANIGIH